MNSRLMLTSFACAVALLFMVPPLGRTQESSSSTGPQQGTPEAKPAGRTGAVGAIEDSGAQEQAPTNSGAPPIQELGRGGWLGEAASPLHWGSLYVGSFNFTQGYDDIRGASSGDPVGIFRTSVFGTNVVFNPRFGRTNLALQWRPQAGFVNGQFADNFNNQDASLELATMLSPRLSMRFQEHFAYVPAQSVFAEGFLFAAQSSANHSIQQSFLDGPGTWLTNTATLTFGYSLSPRTELKFTPGFNYSRLVNTNSVYGTGAGTGVPPPLVGSNEYMGTVSLDHRLSPLKTVGLFYFLNDVKFQNTSTYVSYHTFGGMYSQQLSPTWFVNLTGGASTAEFGRNATNSWTYSGSADIEKRFNLSSISLAYTRSLYLNQYVTRNFTDRVDLNCTVQFTRRLNAGAGYGYQRVDGPPVLSGTYINSRLSYRLLSSLNLLATYVYRNQTGNATQVFTETRNTGYLTLQWDPMHHGR